VPLIEDAAEALGATCGARSAGAFGRCAAFSFNGNKIITTSGGGMLVSRDRAVVELARYLATQARDPAPHYEHSQTGFNYRLSNLLAALGRAQLAGLAEKIAKRRAIRARYESELGALRGLTFLAEAAYGRSNAWLTCLTIDGSAFGASREDVRLHLESRNIEARPVWKPMHLQPLYRHCHVRGGAASARLFETGLCLPSGSGLSGQEQGAVIAAITETPAAVANRACRVVHV
jgi:pyridoxal phosphate-dependent aminotransferase EpsN